jgi:hypothetical protein
MTSLHVLLTDLSYPEDIVEVSSLMVFQEISRLAAGGSLFFSFPLGSVERGARSRLSLVGSVAGALSVRRSATSAPPCGSRSAPAGSRLRP